MFYFVIGAAIIVAVVIGILLTLRDRTSSQAEEHSEL